MISPRIKKLTKSEMEQEIVKAMDEGKPTKDLMEKYGLSREEVTSIYDRAKKIELGE
jgi:Mor family transcriptional regulator